jgi:putative (di)nucleoside polyphosphate hydrolase
MSPEDISKLPYRPNVGIMLVNPKGLVFAGQRLDAMKLGTGKTAWQMPQGGIDEGESPREAALRELHEEIGTDRAEIVAEYPDWLKYDLPVEISHKIWGGQYRGQMQRWFALRFTGRDEDIDLDRHQREFEAWRWEDINRLPDLVVGFKRDIYEQVVAAFRDLALKNSQDQEPGAGHEAGGGKP